MIDFDKKKHNFSHVFIDPTYIARWTLSDIFFPPLLSLVLLSTSLEVLSGLSDGEAFAGAGGLKLDVKPWQLAGLMEVTLLPIIMEL